MAMTNGCAGESLAEDGSEIVHIDLILGPRNSGTETGNYNGLANNKDSFTSLLAVVSLSRPANRTTE